MTLIDDFINIIGRARANVSLADEYVSNNVITNNSNDQWLKSFH